MISLDALTHKNPDYLDMLRQLGMNFKQVDLQRAAGKSFQARMLFILVEILTNCASGVEYSGLRSLYGKER